MNNLILYKEDCKKIIDEFNNLMPWDKADVLKYLSETVMTWNEIEEYFIKGSGYVKWDDIDPVQEVIDNGFETDVLNEMDEYDICDYLLNSSQIDNIIKYMITSGDLSDDGWIDIIKYENPRWFNHIREIFIENKDN